MNNNVCQYGDMLTRMNNIHKRGERFAVLLGAEIKGAIARSGTSARKVSFAIGKQPSNMSLWLNGKRPIPADLLTEICEHIGADQAELVDRAYQRLVKELGLYIAEPLDEVENPVNIPNRDDYRAAALNPGYSPDDENYGD